MGLGKDGGRRKLALRAAAQPTSPLDLLQPTVREVVVDYMAAKAPAERYTLLLAGLGTLAVNPGLSARRPYDPAVASHHAEVFCAPLVVGPGLQHPDLRQFVASMRRTPEG